MKDLKEQFAKLVELLPTIKRYTPVMFGALLLIIYGFVLYRISALSSAQPSPSAVAAQNKTAQVPHIDPTLVTQLQSLQDNSTNVQTLFDQARNNPFQE